VYFHLTLNLLAELLRFGDRCFYKDWWNATTFSTYWRTWNMPVHQWLVRHAYFPMMRAGASKTVANLLVFVISAVFHELLVSVRDLVNRSSEGGAWLICWGLVLRPCDRCRATWCGCGRSWP
jgi:hypothetical protein